MKKPSNGLDSCGKVVKTLRNQYGYTQVELAKRIAGKWDKSRVNKIESDSMPLNRRSIHAIAEALKMRPERLYLMCLKAQYPVLEEGELGALLTQVVEGLEPDSE